MKGVFFLCLVLLAIASLLTYRGLPEVESDRPILYWVTDRNPARDEQIKRFDQWMIRNGHTTPDGKPLFILKLDTANDDPTKKLIQGVSGVSAEIIQTGPMDLPLFQSVGLLEDVTEQARELGFDPTHTYAAIEPQLVFDGRQYRFPANVFAHMLWINKATFRSYDMPPPPPHWDLETFERIGREFIARANASNPQRRVFFVNQLSSDILRRSLGLDIFNETLTRCTLDDPRAIQIYELLYKWTFHDRLLPTSADMAAFATEGGYGGSVPQLFNTGQFAMMYSGRYMLIQFRQFGAMELAVTEPPHGGFRNTHTGTRTASVYAASKHPELAVLFLAYLASEDYNMQIVEDADALPPNPKYTQVEEFLRPAKYPNEWGVHERFSQAAEEIAITQTTSPFVLPSIVSRIEGEANGALMAHRISPTEAAHTAAYRINAEIQRALIENDALRPRYQQLLEDQQTIDRLRAAGEKVPLELIRNPFHRRYYMEMGWAEQPHPDLE